MTATMALTKSGPLSCPVIQWLMSALHPKRKFRMTQAPSPMTRCQRAFARSAMKPFRNFETPYTRPTRVRITPKDVSVMPYSCPRAGMAKAKFFRTK